MSYDIYNSQCKDQYECQNTHAVFTHDQMKVIECMIKENISSSLSCLEKQVKCKLDKMEKQIQEMICRQTREIEHNLKFECFVKEQLCCINNEISGIKEEVFQIRKDLCHIKNDLFHLNENIRKLNCIQEKQADDIICINKKLDYLYCKLEKLNCNGDSNCEIEQLKREICKIQNIICELQNIFFERNRESNLDCSRELRDEICKIQYQIQQLNCKINEDEKVHHNIFKKIECLQDQIYAISKKDDNIKIQKEMCHLEKKLESLQNRLKTIEKDIKKTYKTC